MFEIRGDPDVMMFHSHVWSREETSNWLARSIVREQTDGHGYYAVISKIDNETLGLVSLLKQSVEGETEIAVGYFLKRKHWRQGYATEAARACRDYARTGFGYDRVISLIRPDNKPSQNVAKRLGGVLEENVMWRDFMHGIWVLGR